MPLNSKTTDGSTIRVSQKTYHRLRKFEKNCEVCRSANDVIEHLLDYANGKIPHKRGVKEAALIEQKA